MSTKRDLERIMKTAISGFVEHCKTIGFNLNELKATVKETNGVIHSNDCYQNAAKGNFKTYEVFLDELVEKKLHPACYGRIQPEVVFEHEHNTYVTSTGFRSLMHKTQAVMKARDSFLEGRKDAWDLILRVTADGTPLLDGVPGAPNQLKRIVESMDEENQQRFHETMTKFAVDEVFRTAQYNVPSKDEIGKHRKIIMDSIKAAEEDMLQDKTCYTVKSLQSGPTYLNREAPQVLFNYYSNGLDVAVNVPKPIALFLTNGMYGFRRACLKARQPRIFETVQKELVLGLRQSYENPKHLIEAALNV